MKRAPKIKVIFFGTPEFSVKPLLALMNDPGIEISAVVTQPDKPVGRKQEMLPSPVKIAVAGSGITILQPESVKNNNEFFELVKNLKPDFIVTAAYGKILPVELINIPKHYSINIHASLLPKYRGASPVEQALLNGDSETGITFIRMDEGMDTGDILLIQRLQIRPEDDNSMLRDRLSLLAAGLLPFLLKDIIEGEIRPIPQKNSLASYCKKIEKEDGEIKPAGSTAAQIANQIRALNPWPSTYLFYQGKRIKIISAESCASIKGLEAGHFETAGDQLFLGCMDDTRLKITNLQLEGKNPSSIQDFLRGHSNFFSKSPAR